MANRPLLIKTIGVYGSTEESFFDALVRAGVDTFVDIRQRRAVRGSKYAYVNSTKLQQKLSALGIRYLHIKELAPSTALRERQKQADENSGISKIKRQELGPDFVAGYKQENLSAVTVDAIVGQLPEGARTICLFCVEREPRACHRSLVADFLSEQLSSDVENLLP